MQNEGWGLIYGFGLIEGYGLGIDLNPLHL